MGDVAKRSASEPKPYDPIAGYPAKT